MTNRVGQQVGNYRLVRVLGSGGFADVYLGQHIYLKKRQVAIKIMRDVLHENFQATFLEEAETIAELKYDHVIQLFDYGIDDTPYLIMEYAQKGTLRDIYPRGSIVPSHTIIILIKQIAAALQYSHNKNIIHRDVKPQNFLVRDTDAILLSDFGIAAIAQNTTLMKTTGYAGTVYYSAPEQHQGKARVASDQYALAVVTYEWLTGTVPFTGDTQIEIVLKHLSESPQPLRERVPGISSAVESVVMRALEKNPKDRFGSVQEFADALEQAVTSPSFSASTVLPQQKKSHATPIAHTEHTNEVNSIEKLPERSNLTSGNQGKIVQRTNTLTSKEIACFKGHKGDVSSVAWSPDGRYIVSGSYDATVQVVEAHTGKEIWSYEYTRRVTSVAWSLDSKYLASGGLDNTIRITNVSTGREVARFTGYTYIESIAWSPDGKYIAYSGWDYDKIWIIDVNTSKDTVYSSGHTYNIESVAWSPDGKYIASGSRDKTVRVIDTHTGAIVVCFTNHHTRYVYSVAWSPDGRYIASGSGDHTVWIIEGLTGKEIACFKEYTDYVYSVAWSPDGKYLASGSSHTVKIVNTSIGKEIVCFKGHERDVLSVAWSPDGKYIVSGSRDSTVRVWQVS